MLFLTFLGLVSIICSNRKLISHIVSFSLISTATVKFKYPSLAIRSRKLTRVRRSVFAMAPRHRRESAREHFSVFLYNSEQNFSKITKHQIHRISTLLLVLLLGFAEPTRLLPSFRVLMYLCELPHSQFQIKI